MRALSLDDFQGRAGETYRIDHQGVDLALVLTRVAPLPPSAREGDAFRLDWLGPPEPALPQGIYSFYASGESFDIFIVPVGRDEEGMRYEAIFN
jgi:hypothetical protein